jgi:DNA repair exonuclease SbcCD ATPase subunit
MNWKKLSIPLLVILAVSIAGISIVYATFKLEPKPFGTELAKALIQIATVLALGQLVSVWIDELRRKREEENKERDKQREKAEKALEDERQRAEQEIEKKRQQAKTINELRKELLARLTSAYSDAKRIRRLIKARCCFLSPNTQGEGTVHVRRDVYDEYMQALNNVQLTLETIRREIETSIETSSELFSAPTESQANVEYMESYLRKIIREYEKKLMYFKGDPSSLKLQELNRLSEFISQVDAVDFDTKFVSSYKSTLQSVRKDILAGVKITT